MKGRRVGFTLVELLVVITIISMLMALLLPAVQAAREAGRRATCMNNQSNIAKALMNYESAKGRYPGWRQVVGYRTVNGDEEVVVGSWVVEILPYLEMRPVHDRWKDPNVVSKPSPYIPILACPSDNRVKTRPQLNHVANCGMGRADITKNELVKRENGIFFDHLFEDTQAWKDETVVLPSDTNTDYKTWTEVKNWTMNEMSNDYLTSNDGASNTVLLAENNQARTWTYPPSKAVNSSKMMMLQSKQQLVGFNWDCAMSTKTNDDTWGSCPQQVSSMDIVPARPNTCTNKGPITTDTKVSYKFARPSSNHPGVFVASFCDGRSQTISDGISLKVYQHIMTPNSRAARGRKKTQKPAEQMRPDCSNPGSLYNPADLR